ncbi:hypothetical protein EW026_g1741 [Hermanssonia centrifuga]|uniref:RRM domain-containing protein n=1 Tax=Hermanssonia centrifuga TaxID=98765 RepID=A0A4S4KRD8_9APHY|nr:hypothetical protein EW026_g1741 [Hermanssonia centrifuga]
MNRHEVQKQETLAEPAAGRSDWASFCTFDNYRDIRLLICKLSLPTGITAIMGRSVNFSALFVKTVGPVKESFIVHNSQGNSKGMAVVSFHRVEDAAVARTKYNGKIIDGRRPIKIEIIRDDDVAPKAPPKPTAPPSLLQRLGGKLPPTAPSGVKAPPIIIPPKKQPLPPRAAPAAPRAQTGSVRRPLRQKKGPKRVKKIVKQPMTASQLDAEMEEYRAHGDE